MNRIINWVNGWRWDLDGWLVRARKATDPDLSNSPDIGFTEEACIAVRSHDLAFRLDRGDIR